jgi:hypothetical protein
MTESKIDRSKILFLVVERDSWVLYLGSLVSPSLLSVEQVIKRCVGVGDFLVKVKVETLRSDGLLS